jgi:hypothetical protein
LGTEGSLKIGLDKVEDRLGMVSSFNYWNTNVRATALTYTQHIKDMVNVAIIAKDDIMNLCLQS